MPQHNAYAVRVLNSRPWHLLLHETLSLALLLDASTNFKRVMLGNVKIRLNCTQPYLAPS